MNRYDVMEIGKHCFDTHEAHRHKIDEHNNLHLMDENFEDIFVYKKDRWDWFRVVKE